MEVDNAGKYLLSTVPYRLAKYRTGIALLYYQVDYVLLLPSFTPRPRH